MRSATRLATRPTVGEGSHPRNFTLLRHSLAVSDFKNGVYSIDGVSKTLAQTWRDAIELYPTSYQPLNVVPGVGLKCETSSGTTAFWMAPIAKPELWALLNVPDVGFTFVIDYSLASSGTRLARVGAWTDDDPDFTDWWGWVSEFATNANSRHLEDVSGVLASSAETAGTKRAAVSFGPDGLAMSVNGGAAVATSGPSANTTANEFYLDLRASAGGGGTGTATAIVEKVVFYPLQDASALPGLSA